MAAREPRLTEQSLKVLQAFLNARRYRACGADIVQITKLFPGTAYPILKRFKEAGWLNSKWEIIDPSDAGRPPRLYYTLTGEGQRVARERLSAFAPRAVGARALGAVAWAT
jgi:DNA-binding PadR family transcriptional regulator